MEENEAPTLSSQKKTKKSKRKSGKTEAIKGLLKNKIGNKIKMLILAHIPTVILILFILFIIFFIIGIILFFTLSPGLSLGNIEEFGNTLYQNLQGLLTGDSTTAQISSEEIIDLAEFLESMDINIRDTRIRKCSI